MPLLAALVLGAFVAEEFPPEWVSYQKVLRKAGSFSVSFDREPSFDIVSEWLIGKSGILLVQRPSRLRLDQEDHRFFWDGKETTSVDARTNRLRRVRKPIENKMIRILDLLGEGVFWREGFRTTAALPRSRKQWERGGIETGFMVKTTGRDYTYWTEYWFDPVSHLPVEISSGADGMTTPYRVTYRLYWGLDPISASEFVPAPMTVAERKIPKDSDGVRFLRWPDAPEGSGRLRIIAPTGAVGHLIVEDAEFESPSVSLILHDGWRKVSTRGFGGAFQVRDGFETVVSLGAVLNLTDHDLTLEQSYGKQTIKPGESAVVFPGRYQWGTRKAVVRPGHTEVLAETAAA